MASIRQFHIGNSIFMIRIILSIKFNAVFKFLDEKFLNKKFFKVTFQHLKANN